MDFNFIIFLKVVLPDIIVRSSDSNSSVHRWRPQRVLVACSRAHSCLYRCACWPLGEGNVKNGRGEYCKLRCRKFHSTYR